MVYYTENIAQLVDDDEPLDLKQTLALVADHLREAMRLLAEEVDSTGSNETTVGTAHGHVADAVELLEDLDLS